MEQRIATPAIKNDPVIRTTLGFLNDNQTELDFGKSIFYYDFPIFRDETNKLYRSKGLLVTEKKGIFILGHPTSETVIDHAAVIKLDREISQLDSIIFGKLLRNKKLRKSKRDLSITITTLIVLIDADEEVIDHDEIENKIITSYAELEEEIKNKNIEEITNEEWDELISVLEGAKALSASDDIDLAQLPKESRGYVTLALKFGPL